MAGDGNCSSCVSVNRLNVSATFENTVGEPTTCPAGCYQAEAELATVGHLMGSKVTCDHSPVTFTNAQTSKRLFSEKLLKPDGADRKGAGGSQSDGVPAPPPPEWDHMEHSVRQEQRLCGGVFRTSRTGPTHQRPPPPLPGIIQSDTCGERTPPTSPFLPYDQSSKKPERRERDLFLSLPAPPTLPPSLGPNALRHLLGRSLSALPSEGAAAVSSSLFRRPC